MSIQNDERTITILRMIAEGKLGSDKSGTFAKLEDIIDEFGEKHTVKSIIDFLVQAGYVRKVNDKFEKLHGNKLDYKAYQITEHGKTHLSKNQGSATSISYQQNTFGDVHGSNISINSKYVSQLIEKQDDETKELLEILVKAAETKDKSKILKTLGYIGDKSLDLLIAIVAGGIKL